MNDKEEKSALFWCQLLHAIIFSQIPEKQHHRHLVELSQQDVLFPDGTRKKPSLSTLKRKLKKFNQGGIAELKRKLRNDRGLSRKWDSGVIDKAVELKEDLASRSADTINEFLQAEHKIKIPASTLYRHLKARGATRIKLDVSTKKVRCRWTRDKANELWIGDFSYGPYVYHHGKVKATYLSLFIDCHSRYVVEGRYYLNQDLDILIDTLLRAFSKYGIPEGLYLDNGKVYHANALVAACYDLLIQLIHRTVGDPAPGGLVERLFLSGQKQFETEVRAGDILTLQQLNQGFASWLEVVYHDRKHSDLKDTPANIFRGAIKRTVDMASVIRCFMKKEERVVDKVFSDVTVKTRFYSVNRIYRGDSVMVHYDPFSEISEVFLYDLNNVYLCKAERYDREKRPQEKPVTKQKKPKYSYLDLINEKHEKKIQEKTQAIDFTQLDQRWPFSVFIQQLAQLMGKKSGASAFDEKQLEALKQAYDRFPKLNSTVLTRTFEKAEIKNVHHIIFQLQQEMP